MCRYALHNYSTSWVCFSCRISKKSPKKIDRRNPIIKCTICGTPMIEMGRDFKAPKKSDIKQWEKVKLLYNVLGITYDSCGCDGPGIRPKTLAEAKDVIKLTFTLINKGLRKNEAINAALYDVIVKKI